VPDTLDRHCWASAYVLDVVGDIWTVVEYYHPLPFTTWIGPPKNVQATRKGDEVTVTWDPISYRFPEDLKGYLIEADLCTRGSRIPTALHVNGASATLTDESGCSGSPNAKLYAVEKHGYTDPVRIPWP